MQIIKVLGINGLGKTKGCEKAGNKIIEALSGIRVNESGKKIDTSKLQESKILDSSQNPKKILKSKDFDSFRTKGSDSARNSSEFRHAQKSSISDKEKLDLEEIHLDNSNLEAANELIYENCLEEFEKQDKIIFLGGDHSVSYSIVRAFKDYLLENNKKPFLIVFDAHPDLMESLKEATHEEWLRKLIDDGFPKENIILISVRNSYEDELNFIKENEIQVVDMKTLNEDIEGVCDMIMEKARAADELYISVDIDCLDSAYASATGYPEPGGMTTRQLLYMLQRLKLLKNFKAADIVEINPDKQGSEMTIKTAAKILAELI